MSIVPRGVSYVMYGVTIGVLCSLCAWEHSVDRSTSSLISKKDMSSASNDAFLLHFDRKIALVFLQRRVLAPVLLVIS